MARNVGIGSLLLLGLVTLRLWALPADAPPGMPFDYLSDEGWWSHNARNHAMFGRWIMDEHNPALFFAPLYTITLRAWFSAFGVGLLPVRGLAVVAGLGTCWLIYAALLRRHTPRAALLSTLLYGMGFFVLAMHRTGFVESFLCFFTTAACLSAVTAIERPRLAWLTGALLILALLAKATAASAGVVVGAYWVLELWGQHRRGERKSFATLLWGGVGAVMLTGAFAVVVVVPHWDSVAATFLHRGNASHQGLLPRLMTLGVVQDVKLSYFARREPVLLALVGVLVWRRLSGAESDATNAIERLAWCWLVIGLSLMGLRKDWLEDRHYLWLVPPMAILAGQALSQTSLTLMPSARENHRFLRLLLGAAGTAVFFGLWFRAPLAARILDWGRDVPFGERPGLGPNAASALAWVAVSAVLTVVLVGAAWWGRQGQLRVPSLFFIALFVGFGPLRFLWYLTDPGHTMQQARGKLERIVQRLPAERRVVLGDAADTLTLDIDKTFAFVIRRWEHNDQFMNLDGYARFQPSVVLGDPEGPGFTLLDRFPLGGRLIPIYVRDDLAPSWATAP